MLIREQLGVYCLDCLFSLLLVTPLSVLWWFGTWTILDIYNVPWLVCFLVGLFGYYIVAFWVAPVLGSRIVAECSVKHVIISRVLNYVIAWLFVLGWRGLWYWMDELVGATRGQIISESDEPIALQAGILCAALVVLLCVRGVSMVVGNPFLLLCDLNHQFYHSSPIFGTEVRAR